MNVTNMVQSSEIFGGYKIMQDTLVIWDDLEKPIILCNYSDTGYYTFSREASSLSFKVISDACERRKLTLEIGLISLNSIEANNFSGNE
ncbi:MAG: hypothetical protein JNL51_13305 [Chitinophagaceae bacterium]|nr:hypothetical protein [Chitinophagaceae bacterium]